MNSKNQGVYGKAIMMAAVVGGGCFACNAVNHDWPGWEGAAYSIASGLLAAAAYQDAKQGIIANGWTAGVLLCGVVTIIGAETTDPYAEFVGARFVERTLETVIVLGLLLLTVQLGRILGIEGDLGGGDIKLLGALGFCGGLSIALLTTLVACGGMLAVWAVGCVKRRVSHRSEVQEIALSTWGDAEIKDKSRPNAYPFAPFICPAFLLVIHLC